MPPSASPPPPDPGPRRWFHSVADALVALILSAGYGAPALLGIAVAVARLSQPAGFVVAWIAGIGLSVFVYKQLQGRRRREWITAFLVLVLLVLPIWGLCYSHFLAEPSCRVSACSIKVTRPFAEPEVFGLILLHALTAMAYLISRARPQALRPVEEAVVHGGLVAGVVMQVVVGVHVAPWLGLGFIAPALFLPCTGPLITAVIYVVELHARLVRRGIEADVPDGYVAPNTPFRAGPVQQILPPPPRVHLRSLLRALLVGPALLGVHAVIQALLFQRADAAIAAITGTCSHVLSRVPLEVIPENCHYLCTVAARGHAGLVKPERLGVRHGVPIIVNRQLAVANAFEDLLHDRWPRFGRLARRVYDKVGLPISRHLRSPWLSDLVYLAMKPAEWAFYATLLLLDRGDPEARIDRMYRG